MSGTWQRFCMWEADTILRWMVRKSLLRPRHPRDQSRSGPDTQLNSAQVLAVRGIYCWSARYASKRSPEIIRCRSIPSSSQRHEGVSNVCGWCGTPSAPRTIRNRHRKPLPAERGGAGVGFHELRQLTTGNELDGRSRRKKRSDSQPQDALRVAAEDGGLVRFRDIERVDA